MLTYPSLAFYALVTSIAAPGLVACGGQGSAETSPKDDAGGSDAEPDVGSASDATSGGAISASADAESTTDAGASDSGSLQCGDASCDSTQICLYPACECVAVGGSCPAPSCVTPPSGPGQYDCPPDGVETPECSMVSAPIPSTCSRVCHDNCI
jgi:hypothetical protein